MKVAILGGDANVTNRVLTARWRALGLQAFAVPAVEAREQVDAGDMALGRLDVAPGLDGVEPGLLELLLLERSGTAVLNRARALLTAHDKYRTALALAVARLPHPRTAVIREVEGPLPLSAPLVLKPRFGSWGPTSTAATRSGRPARACARSRTVPGSAATGCSCRSSWARRGPT